MKLSLLVVALGTAIPSTYLAVKLVGNEIFKTNAKKFIAQEFSLRETQVANSKIDPEKRTIEVALIGAPLSQSTLRNIEGRLAVAQLPDSKIVVHQTGDNRIDVTALKSSLLSDLYSNGQEELRKKDEQVKKLQSELATRNDIFLKANEISLELRAQYPSVVSVFVSEGVEISSDGERRQLIQLSIKSSKPLTVADKTRIASWFKVRAKTDAVILSFASEIQTSTGPKSGRIGRAKSR